MEEDVESFREEKSNNAQPRGERDQSASLDG